MAQITEPTREARQDAFPDSKSAKPTKFRWLVLAWIGFVFMIAYVDRGNISLAAPEMAKEFHLSKTVMGLVLASFAWTYAIGQVPVGWLGDRFGPRKVLTVIMTCVGLAPILNGFAVGLTSLFAARLFLGCAESGAFPVAFRGMQMWFAPSERGRIAGICHVYGRLGTAITPFFAASIMMAYGWRAMFYVCGSFGILWAIVFHRYYRNRPEEHKSVNAAELAQIRGLNPDGSLRSMSAERPKVPWRRILGSPNMWYIALGYCCYFFGTNFYVTWYPTYLREYRHLSLKSVGLLGTLPLIGAMLGNVVGGSITDAILKKTGNAKFARRIVAAPGFTLAGLCIIPAAMTHSATESVLCLAASFFCLEWASAASWAVPMDVSGPYAGTVTGIMNCAGALAGSLTAVVYGALFDRGLWLAPFFVSTAVMFLGAIMWLFFINPERSVIEAPVQN